MTAARVFRNFEMFNAGSGDIIGVGLSTGHRQEDCFCHTSFGVHIVASFGHFQLCAHHRVGGFRDRLGTPGGRAAGEEGPEVGPGTGRRGVRETATAVGSEALRLLAAVVQEIMETMKSLKRTLDFL